MRPAVREAIFLSASVPDTRRASRYWTTANIIAIQAAVTALASVVLGRRHLIWGGHPSITPMILVAANAKRIDYGEWVTLYQSRYYRDDFPEENRHFRNVVYTRKILNDPARSQAILRQRMFADNQFSSAIFIGGMEGVEHEYELLRSSAQPPLLVPVASTGGAAQLLYDRYGGDSRLATDLTYVSLFQDLLGLSAD